MTENEVHKTIEEIIPDETTHYTILVALNEYP